MEAPGPDPWRVLGLSDAATLGEARRAFRRLVKRAHPDAGGDAATFTTVCGAFTELRRRLPADPPARRPSPYDRVLRPDQCVRIWAEPHPAPPRRPRPRRDFEAILEAELARV